MGSTTIHPFPELVDLANREADDLHARMWMRLSGVGVEALRAAVLAQLCDLTRPASLDAVCRLIANHQHVDVADVHRTNRMARSLPADMGGAWTDAERIAVVVRHLWPEEAPRG